MYTHKCGRAPVWLSLMILGSLASQATAQSWTPLTNQAPGSAGTMLQLTDGTVMVHNTSQASSWMRLTPDATGNYANGVWTLSPISPMSTGRLYFASQVLPSGKVWVLGGEYSGPNLDLNDAATGEIYDPVMNTWSPIAPYPNQVACPGATVTSYASVAVGSNIVTGIASTARFLP